MHGSAVQSAGEHTASQNRLQDVGEVHLHRGWPHRGPWINGAVEYSQWVLETSARPLERKYKLRTLQMSRDKIIHEIETMHGLGKAGNRSKKIKNRASEIVQNVAGSGC